VTLSAIKANTEFQDFELVRMGRLSVMPVSEFRWKKLLKMAAAK
jgi:predicted RNA-binding protein with PUA-like domain